MPILVAGSSTPFKTSKPGLHICCFPTLVLYLVYRYRKSQRLRSPVVKHFLRGVTDPCRLARHGSLEASRTDSSSMVA
jgi:hypothetical protein